MEKIDNDWDEDRVPICSLDKCRQYDGKRCKLQGFRPDRICKPGVLVMLREQREKIVKLQGGELEMLQPAWLDRDAADDEKSGES